jgi:predicted nucleic acid-binding Zn ribbon protein
MDGQFTSKLNFTWDDERQQFFFSNVKRASQEVDLDEIETCSTLVRQNLKFKTIRYKSDGFWIVNDSSSKQEAVKELENLQFKQHDNLTVKK